MCNNELFVTVQVDDITNTDSNKYYSVTVKYNIQKYIYKKHSSMSDECLSSRVLYNLHVRDCGFKSRRFHFFLLATQSD